MTAPLLVVRDLTVTIDGAGPARDRRVTVLDRVSFTIGAGEILGVVGESGSGKSMTALAVMGLIDAPGARVEGSIRFRDEELLRLPSRRLRRLRGSAIGMIFQDPMSALTPVLTVGAQVDEALRVHRRLGRRAARDRTVELLGLMGIPDPGRVAARYPHQLSGGMRQRATIAMALACDPALLIADEPTTALDVTVQAQILDLLRRLRAEFGSAIMLITHNLGVVAETADRAMVMYAGAVIERGPASDLMRHPRHPYTSGLLRSIPPIGGERPRRLAAIAGAPPAPGRRPPGCAFEPRCTWRHAACLDRPPLAVTDGHEVACVLPVEGRAELVP